MITVTLAFVYIILVIKTTLVSLFVSRGALHDKRKTAVRETKGAFQNSELAGRIMTELVILTIKWRFSKVFFNENPSPSYILFKIWLIWLDSFD